MKTVYDYIVVGAGSAGCVVATRLATNSPGRVLVLEAGGLDRHPLIAMPLACPRVFYRPALNWGFVPEPEAFADNRTLIRGAGKVVGGGSSINGMMYTRGHRLDYDGWAENGAPGWSYSDVLPYFKRLERSWRGASATHGGDGPLSLSRHPPDSLYERIVQTARSKGYPVREDFAAEEADGFGLPDFTVHKGHRGSTWRRYLRPVRHRGNLQIETQATVTRIVFEGRRARGVEFLQGGKLHEARVAQEVVLCGGAYNSPKLLLLSGVGPAAELEALGIKPLHDLPGVGRNLQEHPGAGIGFAATTPQPIDRALRLDKLLLACLRWKLTGSGALAGLPFSGMGFLRTEGSLAQPDVEVIFTPCGPDPHIWFPGWRRPQPAGIGISAHLMRPQSRGSVTLRSADPLAPPRIKLNLLAHPHDRSTLVRAIRLVREFMATPPVAQTVGAEVSPGAGAASDEALARHIRGVLRTMQHPTSTCSMGVGAEAVVDPTLQVHGITGLRVIDASVMPMIVTGHTNGPTIMIAEKGADLILGRGLPREDVGKSHVRTLDAPGQRRFG